MLLSPVKALLGKYPPAFFTLTQLHECKKNQKSKDGLTSDFTEVFTATVASSEDRLVQTHENRRQSAQACVLVTLSDNSQSIGYAGQTG